jgi:penicillin amidase
MNQPQVKLWTVRVLAGLAASAALLLLALWLFLRGSLAQLDGTRHVAGLHAPVSVARDALGVPLIRGGDRRDVAYATGFVHAQERFFQMDLLRRVAAGELAELFGPRALAIDKLHRLHRFRARAEQAWRSMPDDERQFLDCYVAGVNDGLGALAARPFEYALTGATPRPWSAPDSLLVVWAMFFDLQGNLEPRELARGWIGEHADPAQRAFLLPEASVWDAPLDAADGADAGPPAAPIPPSAPAWWGQRRGPSRPTQLADSADAAHDAVGSNNWAVAGSRSGDGAAIVSDDMHLGIALPNIWYRLALQFPNAGGGTRRMAGVTLPGAPPFVIVGSNGHVAWGFTNSYGDFLDLVALGTDPARPGQVRTPDGWETLSEYTESILVKGAPAAPLVVRDSSLGPLRVVGGRSYAIHWSAHLPTALNLNHRRLESADTLAQALAVAATLGIPGQNFVAGDDRGNIGWTIAGQLPRRAQGGSGATFPLALDGAERSWQGLLAPADYPKLVNPAQGQISTANNRQLMGPGARLIGDGGVDLGARNRQLRDDLRALGAKTDVRAVAAVALDDRAIFLASWRARAIKALDATALAGQPRRAEFLRLLQQDWSGHASVESAGYRLTREFMWAMYELLYGAANGEMAALDDKASAHMASSRWPALLARLLDAEPAGWLPPAYPSWQALQLAAVDRVIGELGGGGKTLAAATWGERNTATIAHPISAGAPFLRRWLAAPADMLAGDAHMPRVAGRNFGQSERMTVSPGKEEQGVFNMPGGQSAHPLSPYFLQGHEDWVKGRPMPLLPGVARNTLTFEPSP